MVQSLLLGGLGFCALGLILFLAPPAFWQALTSPGSKLREQTSVAAAVLFTGLTVAGIGVVMWSTGEVLSGRASMHWVAVDAEILNTSLTQGVEARTGRKQWRPRVHYRYTWEGAAYEGRRLSFGLNTFPDASAGAETLQARYAPGSRHPVYVDPADPANSVLVPGMDVLVLFLGGIGLLFAMVGLLQLRGLARAWVPEAA
ncbi:MAG: DUF3592 domain-containing protein [Gemmatimonadaceae bacterium]|nr:DUF3592 domain-containing protein [Gemmatimonadaceae bacterium]MCW5827636.1 DUF3592 domain-containing protein [Gemmatimonadaceae bacterium]